uniref:Uncharacterized protein n=1 Tax=Prymnesium polylepis TaxID=72548 RepID=A0A7S4HDR8_9EUKA
MTSDTTRDPSDISRQLLPDNYGEGGVPPTTVIQPISTRTRRTMSQCSGGRIERGGNYNAGRPVSASAALHHLPCRQKLKVAESSHRPLRKPHAAEGAWDPSFLPVPEPPRSQRGDCGTSAPGELAALVALAAPSDPNPSGGKRRTSVKGSKKGSSSGRARAEEHAVVRPVGRDLVENQLHLLLDEISSPRCSKLGPRLESRSSSGSSQKEITLGTHPGKCPPKHLSSSGVTRNFLQKVLADRPQSASKKQARGHGAVPEWKADIVERVRRRIVPEEPLSPFLGTPTSISADNAGSRAASMAGQAPTDIAQFQANNADGTDDDMRSPRRRWPRSDDELASLTSNGTSAGGKSMLLSFEERLRKRQESVQHYMDAISDLQLTEQLQASEKQTTLTQVEKLVRRGAAAGELATRQEREMHEKRKRLSAHLNVVEERASEAEQVNAGLESTINELRLARQRHTMHNNACAAKEKTMAFDMHGFAAGAHAALDEKERLAGRLRRLRHEYKQEVAGTDQELEVIHHTLNELQAFLH